MNNMTPDEMAREMDPIMEASRELDQQKQLSAEQMGMPAAEPDRLKDEPKERIYLVSVMSCQQVSEEGHIEYSAKNLLVTERTTIAEIFKWIDKIRLRAMHGVQNITITEPEKITNNQQKENS